MPIEQLQLQLDPGLADRHASLLACVAERVFLKRGGMQKVAPALDLSPSHLGEILAGGGARNRKFGLDHLERFIATYNDITPILYLIARYMPDQAAAHNAALARIADLTEELPGLLAMAGMVKSVAGKGKRK